MARLCYCKLIAHLPVCIIKVSFLSHPFIQELKASRAEVQQLLQQKGDRNDVKKLAGAHYTRIRSLLCRAARLRYVSSFLLSRRKRGQIRGRGAEKDDADYF